MGYVEWFARIGAGDLPRVGGKAANLGELTAAGLPVPPGFVLTTDAYEAFLAAHGVADAVVATARAAAVDGPAVAAARIAAMFRDAAVPPAVADALDRAHHDLVGAREQAAVAVRSSANAEDLADASFAGQQDTLLEVRGGDAVHRAVVACWASLWSERALAYRARRGIDPASVRLAVVVQRMVHAEASGVMFTADPTTGRRDRIVVGAAWGLGESVVGGTVSTDDHVIDKATGRVVSRRTAEKAVMTVAAAGGSGTEERAVPDAQRRAPVLDDAAAEALARLGLRVEQHYGAPQDIEWARTADGFALLQSRPVTALPAPADDPPTTWTPPRRDGVYFRVSIVEQMPDPLTPLFADLVDAAVTRSLRTLMNGLLRREVVHDGDVGLPTVNGYAYYYYRTSALLRVTALTPLALWSLTGRSRARSGTRGGPRGWREQAHPRYEQVVAAYAARELDGTPGTDLLDDVVALLDAAAEYYTAVQSAIPVAVTAEVTFSGFYERLVRRAGDPPAATFLLGSDSEPIRADHSLHDLALAARGDAELAAALTRTDSDVLVAALRSGTPPAGVEPDGWTAWCDRLRRHLERYGHAVYTLDFAEPVPADEPGPLLDAVRDLLTGGTDPVARQRRLVAEREQAVRAVRQRLDPARRAVFDRLLRWAQDVGPVREDALADLGLAWPTMRRMLHELGRRLVGAGLVDGVEDVFWLRERELRAALVDAVAPEAGAVARRRARWRGRRRAVPPVMLPATGPARRFFASMLPAADAEQGGTTIRGVPGASGRVSGRARVLAGPADFASMRAGEILVARITTPAWTPLFGRAAAVVTDVGGPLSHSSIVAREYGIPAVLGTGAATTRIHTGQMVHVDGDAGVVTLDEDGSEDLVGDDLPG